MRLEQADVLEWKRWSLRLQSVVEIFGLPRQLRLEPATHTSEALAERYLNGSLISNKSFRPSTSSTLIVLSQIYCPEEVWKCCKAIPALLSNNLAW
jgi:hypothetical protein